MASTGRDFGVMVLALLQAAFSRLLSAFSKKAEPTSPSSKKTYHLDDPQQLLQAWERNPYLVMKIILDLLDKNFPLAKQILMNIAADWKEHPKRYAQYDRELTQRWKEEGTGKRHRINMVTALNTLWKQLTLSPDQLKLEGRIIDADLTSEESFAMTPTMDRKILTDSQISFRGSLDALKQAKSNCVGLWDYIYAFLQQDEGNFSDLHLDSVSEHVEPLEVKSVPMIEMDFGHMMERMLHFRNFHRLLAGGALEKSNRLLLSIFEYLKRCENAKGEGHLLDEYPKVKELIELASPLLRNPEKAAQIHQIIREMIQTIMPISKSSPTKSSRVRRPPSRFSPE